MESCFSQLESDMVRHREMSKFLFDPLSSLSGENAKNLLGDKCILHFPFKWVMNFK